MGEPIKFELDPTAPKPFSETFELVYQRKGMRLLDPTEIKEALDNIEKERKSSIRDNFDHAVRCADFLGRALPGSGA